MSAEMSINVFPHTKHLHTLSRVSLKVAEHSFQEPMPNSR